MVSAFEGYFFRAVFAAFHAGNPLTTNVISGYCKIIRLIGRLLYNLDFLGYIVERRLLVIGILSISIIILLHVWFSEKTQKSM